MPGLTKALEGYYINRSASKSNFWDCYVSYVAKSAPPVGAGSCATDVAMLYMAFQNSGTAATTNSANNKIDLEALDSTAKKVAHSGQSMSGPGGIVSLNDDIEIELEVPLDTPKAFKLDQLGVATLDGVGDKKVIFHYDYSINSHGRYHFCLQLHSKEYKFVPAAIPIVGGVTITIPPTPSGIGPMNAVIQYITPYQPTPGQAPNTHPALPVYTFWDPMANIASQQNPNPGTQAPPGSLIAFTQITPPSTPTGGGGGAGVNSSPPNKPLPPTPSTKAKDPPGQNVMLVVLLLGAVLALSNCMPCK